MEEVASMLHAGKIWCINPVQSYDVSRLDSALLTLSKGKHIGKFVVSYEHPQSMVRIIAPVPRARFKSDAEYVLVGGLGGFGRSILRWLIARGAQHLTIFRRSTTIEEEAKRMIQDPSMRGVSVSLRQVDVTSQDQVHRNLAEIARLRPVMGIIHAAMQPVDTNFDQISYQTWKLGLSAKVQGTINLHTASMALDLPLDFFIMTGSIMSVLGPAAHATYCASNAFQDAFARYRRSLGLPGCTISFGLITEITEVARRDLIIKANRRQQLYMSNGELETLQLFEAAFLGNPPESDGTLGWQRYDTLAASTITAFWDPTKLADAYHEGLETDWHKNKKYSHIVRAFKNQLDDTDLPSQAQKRRPAVLDAVDDALGRGSKEEAVGLVVVAISGRMAGLLEIDQESVDPRRGVAEYGVDSLIAVEMRNWLQAVFNHSIPLLKLLDERTTSMTLAELVIVARAEATRQ